MPGPAASQGNIDGANHAPMAQEELYEEKPLSASPLPSEHNLEKIVQMPTWREVLIELVYTHQLDPWDIDVVEITRHYIERIRKMSMQDLRIPANLILAAAILLRFKSDMLRLEEPVVQPTLEEYYGPENVEEIPILQLRGRIPPKRRVTLQELVEAVEEVFSLQLKRQQKPDEIIAPPAIEIKLSEFNLDAEMESLRAKISKLADSQGLVLFSALLDEPTRYAVVYTLLPLLFLAQHGEVSLAQDPFFGEIFIHIFRNNNQEVKKKAKNG